MILQALVQYYECLLEQNKASRLGWCQAKVSHAIELNEDGTIKSIHFIKQEKQLGKKTIWIPVLVEVPEMVTRSSGVSANFLCDNAKYFLGFDSNGVNERNIECFQAAKKRHLELLENAGGTMAKAICSFFKTWNPETALENPIVKEHLEELKEGGNIIFCMKMIDAQEDEEIINIWEKQSEEVNQNEEGICLVTGRKDKIARIHRGIKGVPGAQSSGAALVSFNASAFESYGKEQSYNAPVGKYAEFAYTTALNYLLSQEEYRFSCGDSMVVFWTESGQEAYQNSFLSWLNPSDDNQQEMRKIFENLKRGIWGDLNDIQLNSEQKFYILCLAPNAARLSVRFFYQDSFGNLIKNLSKHYERMEIIQPSWEENAFLGIRRMLDETVNQKAKDKTPISNMAAMVLRAVLEDTVYPVSLYSDTLIRIRAEQGKITCGRAAIIKAYLIKNYHWKEGEGCIVLNEKLEQTEYVLGRIFAALELIQKDANPGINTTIRERYFNSACATPASVFPILIKLKNSHMKKLERENGGAKMYYEKLLTELMGKISINENVDGFPRRLTLEEQGKFILGYYHQMQKKYEKKEEK